MAETRRPITPIARGRTSGLSLASVTAVLRHLIENGLASRNVTTQLGSEVIVSAIPPDRIPSGGDERAQLNVFLHQVTPHVTLARSLDNLGLVPALSVELHYLITAYGAQDYESEILLGHAISVLHDASTLPSQQIREALHAVSTPADGGVVPPAVATLAQSDLADQVEELRVTPEFLNSEEVSKLWSAMQARFRPSVAYKVTSVPAATNGG